MRKVLFVAALIAVVAQASGASAFDNLPGPDFLRRPWVTTGGASVTGGGFGCDGTSGTVSIEYQQYFGPKQPPAATASFSATNRSYSFRVAPPTVPSSDFPVDAEVVVRCPNEFGPMPLTITKKVSTSAEPRVFASIGQGSCGVCRAQTKGFTATGVMNELKANLFVEDWMGGSSIAIGDFGINEDDDIVSGSGPGVYAIVNVQSQDTNFINNIDAFIGFKGGVNVAAGDVTGDGLDDIVVAARAGGGPHVKVLRQIEPGFFDTSSPGFFAYEPGFEGGVSVAVADVVGDATPEIITGAGKTGGPHIKVFNPKGQLLRQFLAFEPFFTGGVNVAAANLVPTVGKAEIVVGAGPGRRPQVRVFNPLGVPLKAFYAFPTSFQGGVTVAAGNVDASSAKEIVVGAQTGQPRVRVFNADGTPRTDGSFWAFPNLPTGVNVAVAR